MVGFAEARGGEPVIDRNQKNGSPPRASANPTKDHRMSDETIPVSVEVVPDVTQEARLYAAACHFAGLPIFITFALANVVAPLVIWLIKKDTMPFVDAHGKESLNFQLTMLIAYIVAAMLVCVYIGVVLIPALVIVQVIFPFIAGISAYDGKPYKYPLTIRMIQ